MQMNDTLNGGTRIPSLISSNNLGWVVHRLADSLQDGQMLTQSSLLVAIFTSRIIRLLVVGVVTNHLTPGGTSSTDFPCCCNGWRTGKRTVGTTTNAIGYTVIPAVGKKSASNASPVSRGLLACIVAISVTGKRWSHSCRGVETGSFSTGNAADAGS